MRVNKYILINFTLLDVVLRWWDMAVYLFFFSDSWSPESRSVLSFLALNRCGSSLERLLSIPRSPVHRVKQSSFFIKSKDINYWSCIKWYIQQFTENETIHYWSTIQDITHCTIRLLLIWNVKRRIS